MSSFLAFYQFGIVIMLYLLLQIYNPIQSYFNLKLRDEMRFVFLIFLLYQTIIPGNLNSLFENHIYRYNFIESQF